MVLAGGTAALAGYAVAAIGSAAAGGAYAAGNAGSRRWRYKNFAIAVATPLVLGGLGRWSKAFTIANRYSARRML